MSNTSHGLARSLHDIGLAAWFGGSLMGAVGLNGGAATAEDPSQRAKIASAGWNRWTPVNAAAIGAHLAGAVVITVANKGRLTGQKGVMSASVLKTAATAGAMAATAYGRSLGKTISEAGSTPVDGVTEPGAMTPAQVADAQRKERYVQWAIPALTGAMLVVNAKMGEQQQPAEVVKGLVRRLNPLD